MMKQSSLYCVPLCAFVDREGILEIGCFEYSHSLKQQLCVLMLEDYVRLTEGIA